MTETEKDITREELYRLRALYEEKGTPAYYNLYEYARLLRKKQHPIASLFD